MLIIAAAILLSIILVDQFYPRLMPNLIIHFRVWATLIATLLVGAFTLLSRKPLIISFLIGFIALLPHLVILTRLLNQKSILSYIRLPLMIVASLFASVFVILSQSLLAMHNGYPNPLIIIPLLWSVAVALLIVEPRQYYSTNLLVKSRMKILKFVSLSFLPLTIMAWFLFTQFVFHQAQAIAKNENWCIRETDRTHIYSGLWLSPRKMFLENNYKGSTSPYLLLRFNGKSWSHHWSFAAMDFIENETDAFLGNLSFYKTIQKSKPC